MSDVKLIVAGSRDFNNFVLLEWELTSYIVEKNLRGAIEIVSGGAKGTDKLGEQFAVKNNLTLKIFPADWNKYGKSAGYYRNKEMAEYATHCICFWDGKSKGTKIMIEQARLNNLRPEIVMI